MPNYKHDGGVTNRAGDLLAIYSKTWRGLQHGRRYYEPGRALLSSTMNDDGDGRWATFSS